MKHANRALTVLIFIFLYIPMAVLIVASFNTGKDIAHFEGFTLQRYVELFQDEHLLQLLRNSLIISVLSTAVATAFGTVAAVGIHNLKPKMRKVVMSLTNIPMTNPDIVTGVSLSLLFVFVGTKMLGQRDALTFWTLLIAHITFNLPYVILYVMPKLQQVHGDHQHEDQQEQQREHGVHLGLDGLFGVGVALNRQGHEVQTGDEIADDEIVQTHGEGHDGAGNDAGHNLMQRHLEEGLQRRAA